MTPIVIDASVALAWCFEDEAAPATDELLDRVKMDGAFVPSLWHLEVANALLLAERRARRITGGIISRLGLLGELPIDTDTETADRAWRETLVLARAEKLTAYDAAYLELAMRRGLPLATTDRDLRDAAARVGVTVLP